MPTERPGPHIQGDVRPLLRELREPLGLVHRTPAVHLHLTPWLPLNIHYRQRRRWRRMVGKVPRGMECSLMDCLNANAPMVAVENPPRMHERYARKGIANPYDVHFGPFRQPYFPVFRVGHTR